MLRHIYETLCHKVWVARFMFAFAFRLMWRGVIHDLSKFNRAEAPTFARATPRLKNHTYGSDAYMENLERLDGALEHHYRHNSHHPEHYQDGVRGMNLLDVVEMLCDWRAAASLHSDGDIYKSIEVNRERFDLSTDMVQVLMQTLPDEATAIKI